MPTSKLLSLVLIFFFTSLISVITGSTSLITVPVMIELGIDPHVAVATNMMALIFMSLGGSLPFARKSVFKRSLLPVWVYFAEHSGSTTTLQAASINPTGTELRVEGMPGLSFVQNWTLVREGVYFFPAEDFRTLNYFDFASKRARPVGKVRGGVFFGSSVSPDGRYILYAQLDQPRSDIMLVNGFR